MGKFDLKVRFAQSPVARLATVTSDGAPHLVPVVFAVARNGAAGNDGNDVIYTAVDAKPKSTQRLRRITNIQDNPHACVLVDHYTDDWTQLWWVRADGVAAVHHDGDAKQAGYQSLHAKYAQYQSVSLNGPVITINVLRWSSWHA